MPSNKALIGVIAAAATTVAVVGVIAMKKRGAGSREEEDEDAFSTSSPLSVPKTASSVASKSAEKTTNGVSSTKTRDAPAAVVPSLTVSQSTTAKSTAAASGADDLLEAALKELEPKVAPIGAAATTTDSAVAKDAPARMPLAEDGRSNLPHLGVSLKAPSGWEIREELSPVPNVAMVTVWNPEFADMPNASEVPGAVPVIILSVEDIRSENLNLSEFKDRSRNLALQQMLMMTGGAIQPVVRKDAAHTEGPFRHMLEYGQSMPPFMDISVINLLEVRNGIAYVFQIMCSPKVMNQYKSIFLQLARDTVLTTLPSSSLGYLDIHTGKVGVHIDTTWSWRVPESDAKGPLAIFELNSSVKKEEISLYETGKVAETAHKVRNTKDVEGVTIVSAFDGAQELKTASYGGFTLVIKPLQKAISYLPEAALVFTIKSVTPSSELPKPKNGATFVSSEYGYHFDVIGGSRVVSTKLGNGTVVYAPLGIPQDMTKEPNPEEQGPTVTVRIGSPANDPDCMSSLEEWQSRIQAEAAEGNITNIKVEPLKGLQCLTFTSKDMQEVGPNQRVEIRGNVYIFVRDGVTTLIRWETTTGLWRKFERDLNVFLESFQFN